MTEPVNYKVLRDAANAALGSGDEARAAHLATVAQLLALLPSLPTVEPFTTFATRGPADWARANGFAVKEFHHQPPDSRHVHVDEGWKPGWRTAAAAFLAQEPEVALGIDGRDVWLSLFGFSLGTNKLDERFDVFSASDMLVYDDYWLPWISWIGPFGALSPDRRRFQISFEGAEERSVAGRHMFIGSRGNWGHWLLDFASKLVHLKDYPGDEAVPLVFGPLGKGHRNSLRHLGVAEERIVEMPLHHGRFTRWRFENLEIIPEVPKPQAFHFLRGAFAASRAAEPGPKRVFLSRKSQFPRHRVANGREVTALLEKLDFTVVEIETLPFAEQLRVLQDAEVIVLSFGADIGNLAMCNPDAACVMLISQEYGRTLDPELVRREAISAVFGNGLPTVPVYGTVLDAGVSMPYSRNIMDAPAHFDVGALAAAVEKAISLAG